MAVRPWIGQIAEPTSHNPFNPAPPDIQYKLDYVYGYRSADTRQNVKYNNFGEVVYMTAALGIVMHPSNTQKFFGGQPAETAHKSKANNMTQHTDDILALAISNDRKTVVTGQVGSAPVMFTWDSYNCEMKKRFQLPKGSRGVNAVAFSEDGSLIACVDLANDHNVYVFDAKSGTMKSRVVGDTNKIFDVAFSNQRGSKAFATAGAKHFYVWDAETGEKQRGLFGDKEATSFSCCIWDDKGRCFAGGANGLIYVFQGRTCVTTIAAHKAGFISALTFSGGFIFSGGKDGQVFKIYSNLDSEAVIQYDSPVRAIDISNDGKMVCGLRNGSIIEIEHTNQREIMFSHSDGETWGLDVSQYPKVLTSGDDNKVIVWDTQQHKKQVCYKVTDRVSGTKRGGASTLSDLPASQCSRACVFWKG
jgi:hypothetical protein